MFQCMEKSQRKVLAVGGRYDALIQEYQTKSDKALTRSVGFRLNILELIAYVRAQTPSSSKATKSSAVDNRLAVTSDLLVTSFDASTLRGSCVEILSCLWAAGLSAELSEEFGSLGELERAYANAGYWLVIVREGRELKVRSPSKTEDEVKKDELVAFLRVKMGKK